MANELTGTTQLANLLEQTYSAGFHLKANWKRRVSLEFIEPDTMSAGYGNQINMGIIDTAASQTHAGTDQGAATLLTYNQDTETTVAVTPTRIYSGLNLNPAAQSRFLRSEAFRQAKQKQLLAALAATVDTTAAQLFASASNTVGGAGQDWSESLLAAALAKLATNAKDYFEPGVTMAYACVIPIQLKNIITQPNWANAQVRGDGTSAVVTGWVNKAYGVNLTASGNVYVNAGVAYNPLHVKGSHVLGWWDKIHLLEPQKNGLATYVIATGEHGSKELDTDLCVAIQTQNV